MLITHTGQKSDFTLLKRTFSKEFSNEMRTELPFQKVTEMNIQSNLIENWRYVLIVVATLSFGRSSLRVLRSPGLPPVGADPAIFQHAGWYITQGAVPYIDIWDVKPPLTFETTTILAYISGGNMLLLHYLSVIVTVAAGIGIVYLTGVLTHELTNDRTAGLAAGLTILAFTGFHYLPAQGFYPKYFSIFFGLLAIILQHRNNPVSSGAAAAMSAGYIQHGAIFAILVSFLAIQQGGRKRLTSTLGGMIGLTLLVILPIIYVGATGPMLVEVVVAHLTSSESVSSMDILRRLAKGFLFLGFSSAAIILGVYGIILNGMHRPRKTWWIAAGGVGYGVQIMFFDFDSYPDLFFGLVFAALGMGLLVNLMTDRQRTVTIVLLAVLVTVGVVSLGGFGIVTSDSVYTKSLDDSLDESDTLLHNFIKYAEDRFNAEHLRRSNRYENNEVLKSRPDLNKIYWNKMTPSSCHYRLSETEIIWIEQTDRSYYANKCGSYPW